MVLLAFKGQHYAVTNEAQVDVFVRDAAAPRFKLLGSINAPETKLYPGQGTQCAVRDVQCCVVYGVRCVFRYVFGVR